MRYWMGSGNQNAHIQSDSVDHVYSDVIVNRISLPTYNKFEVKLINALALKQSFFEIDLYSNHLVTKFECCGGGQGDQNTGKQAWLEFNVGKAACWASLSILPDFIFTDNEKLRSLLNSMSNTIKMLTYEVLLAPLLLAIENTMGQQIIIKTIKNQYPQGLIYGGYGRCTFSLTNVDKEQLMGSLIVSEDLTDSLFSLINLLPGKQSQNNCNLSFNARLQLGYTRLTFIEIRSLEIGDVIFVECLYSPDISVFKAQIYPNLTFLIKNEASHFMVEEVVTGDIDNTATVESVEHLERNISTEAPAAENIPGVAFDDLQVNLTFELGSMRISLEEVRQLQPGSIFPLERPLDKAVNIYNNGRLFGTAELVEIENKIGVRLLEFIGN